MEGSGRHRNPQLGASCHHHEGGKSFTKGKAEGVAEHVVPARVSAALDAPSFRSRPLFAARVDALLRSALGSGARGAW